MKLTTLLLAFVSLVACTKQDQRRSQPPTDPRSVDGPVNCAADELKANEKCFTKAQDGCDYIACAEGCDIFRSRTSRWITCAVARTSASMVVPCGGPAKWPCPENTVCSDGICLGTGAVTRCEGYSGWSCPENTVCSDDPRPNGCSRKTSFDCIGLCVPTRP